MNDKDRFVSFLKSLGVEFSVSTKHPSYVIVSPLDGDGDIAADFYFRKSDKQFVKAHDQSSIDWDAMKNAKHPLPMLEKRLNKVEDGQATVKKCKTCGRFYPIDHDSCYRCN